MKKCEVGKYAIYGLPPTDKVGVKVIQVKLRITRAEVISLLLEEVQQET